MRRLRWLFVLFSALLAVGCARPPVAEGVREVLDQCFKNYPAEDPAETAPEAEGTSEAQNPHQ